MIVKNVRSSQPCTSMNFCTEFSEALVLSLDSPKDLVKIDKTKLKFWCKRFYILVMRFGHNADYAVLWVFPFIFRLALFIINNTLILYFEFFR